MGFIKRGRGANIIIDDKLKVATQLAVPVKEVVSGDETGSIAAGNTNRLKAKMANNTIKEIANSEDLTPIAQAAATANTNAMNAQQSVQTLDNSLAAVAKSGDYNNLLNKPTVPTIPSTNSYNSEYAY